MTGGTLIAGKNRVPAHRPLRQTSPINDPGANFLSASLRISHKQRKTPEMNKQKGRPVETAAAVEIDSGGLRQLFIDDFHPLLEKAYAQTAAAFSQLRTGPTAVNK
jgi:hypothetical protein